MSGFTFKKIKQKFNRSLKTLWKCSQKCEQHNYFKSKIGFGKKFKFTPVQK